MSPRHDTGDFTGARVKEVLTIGQPFRAGRCLPPALYPRNAAARTSSFLHGATSCFVGARHGRRRRVIRYRDADYFTRWHDCWQIAVGARGAASLVS